jgi:hypothetical protein
VRRGEVSKNFATSYEHACEWETGSPRNCIRVVGEAMRLSGRPFSFHQWRGIAQKLKAKESENEKELQKIAEDCGLWMEADICGAVRYAVIHNAQIMRFGAAVAAKAKDRINADAAAYWGAGGAEKNIG